MLAAGDPQAALRYVAALEDYTCNEPLPWSQLFAARGRALAAKLESDGEGTRHELARIRTALIEAGLKLFLPPVEAALAA
jgi:hypothetical protein